MDTNLSMYAFMRAYRGNKDGIAVIRGAHQITFDHLEKQIDRVAGGLYSLGVRPGDIVMSALPNIEQGVVLLYAVSKLGAVLSPVHPLVSEDEFAREVRLQRPKVAVLSDVNMFQFFKHLDGTKFVYCPYWMYAYVGLPLSKKFEQYKGNGDVPALYMHSGGTSGVPKTVVLSARAANSLVANLLSSIPYEFDGKDGMLVTLPMFHGFGLIVGVHVSLSTNMSAVLVPKFKGKKAVAAIRKNKITTMIAVPRMLKKLLETDSFSGENIECLHNVYVGGDTLDSRLSAEFNERMKSADSDAVCQQGYGLTEVGSVCALSPKDGDCHSVGQIINNLTALIVDESDMPVADGETGELLIAGEQLMNEYLGDKNSTSAAFLEFDGVTYLRTGDLFSAKGKNLYYEGRKKRLIKISGMNVFPAEIERVAIEFGVNACAAVEIKYLGKTYIRLVVEGELSDKQKNNLMTEISHKLSHWHAPREIVCVNELPMTAIGKIDYVRLSDEYK